MTARSPMTGADYGAAAAFAAPPAQRLDNRGLPPPEPLVRTLEAVEAIPDGAILEILVDREPLILYSELKIRGYAFQAQALDNGDYRVLIQHRPGG